MDGVHLVVTRIAGKSTISDSYVSSFVDETRWDKCVARVL